MSFIRWSLIPVTETAYLRSYLSHLGHIDDHMPADPSHRNPYMLQLVPDYRVHIDDAVSRGHASESKSHVSNPTAAIWCRHMVVDMSQMRPVQLKISHLKKPYWYSRKQWSVQVITSLYTYLSKSASNDSLYQLHSLLLQLFLDHCKSKVTR